MSNSVRTSVIAALAVVVASHGLTASHPTRQMVPLTDMGDRTYYGFEGGLYPDGSNVSPPAHITAGLRRANAIEPLDVFGDPHPNGSPPCDAWTFMGQAAVDPRVNRRHLLIANGAEGGRAAAAWDSPDDRDYDRVRDEVLGPLGVSDRQVQIVWLKVANARPTVSLPSPDADALQLLESLGHIARALEVRYPNLQQVFLSSRIYAGYATTPLNPEPFAWSSS